MATTGDGPTEAVNDARHGIESIEPAPTRRNERRRISNGRGEHPELNEKWDDVADVPVKGIEGGHPKADAESGEESEKKKNGKPESGQSGEKAVGEGEDREDGEADGEVHEAGKSGGDGKNQAREINLGDEALVVHDDVGGGLEGVGKIGPGNESGEIKNGIGEAVGGELCEAAEEKSEDEHGEDGLNDDPEDTDGGLFVADFDVAPDEEIEEFAGGPNFAEAKLEEAAGRLNADDGRCSGVERKSGGLGG